MTIKEAWKMYEHGDIPPKVQLKEMLKQVSISADYLLLRVKHYGWLTYIDTRLLQHKLEELIKVRK